MRYIRDKLQAVLRRLDSRARLQLPANAGGCDQLMPEWSAFVHDSVIVRDLRGRIVTWSDSAGKLYGRTLKQAVGQDIDELLQSQYAQSPDELNKQLLDCGSWNGEVQRKRADGQILTVEVRCTVVRNRRGNPETIVEAGRDLTEQKQRSEALTQSEYRYRNLFQAMAASFWEIDFTGVGKMIREIRKQGVEDLTAYFAAHPDFVREMMRQSIAIDCNDQTVTLFRGTKEQLMGGTDYCWPEESNAHYAASVVASLSGNTHYSVETRLRRRDGTEFDALFTACFPQGTVARGILVIGVLDITERKESFAAIERIASRYRTLFQAAAVAFLQLDSRGLNALFDQLHANHVLDLHTYIDEHPEFIRTAMEASIVVHVNEKALQLYGANTREDLLGPVTRFWMPTRTEAFRGSIEAAYKGLPSYQAETKLLTVDGKEVDVLFFVSGPAEMRQNGIILVGAIDIHEQVAARAAMKQLQNNLAHSSRVSMLGELTASIAHELNQPLAAIVTSTEAGIRWLSHDPPNLDEMRAANLHAIASAQRAVDIITRVRAMATRKALEIVDVSMNEIVGEALQFLRYELSASKTHITLELAPELPAIRADRVQIQQVLVNLLINAIQAMGGNDQSSLHIATFDDGSWIRLQISDAGPGISPQALPRLFESFFSTKENEKGMGLGLAVCRSITERHGGTIRASNREGSAGATFVVRLPASTPQSLP